MKSRPIGFGIFLLTIGILWVLMNVGVLNWSIFDSLLKLWPLILVVIGVNVIFRNNPIVKTVVWLAFLAAIIGYSYFIHDNGSNTRLVDGGNISIERAAETNNGELKLSLGGANVSIDATAANLIDGTISDPDIRHSVEYRNGKETAVVSVKKEQVSIINQKSINGTCELHLNENVAWDMDVKTGAVSGKLDLSKLKVKKLDLSVGAAKLDMIFGNNPGSTRVKLDAGASSIDVTFPESVGVKIKMDGALNGSNLKDLGWEKQGHYYTSPNYNDASSKIDMDVNMGVGNFHVNIGSKPV